MNIKELEEVLGTDKTNELISEMEQKDNAIKELEEQLKTKDEQLKDNEKEIKDKNKELEKNVKTLEDKDKNINDLTEKLGASGDNIKALESQVQNLQIEKALDVALVKNGCKNIKATKSLIDMESIKIEDGVINGVNEEIERLLGSDESSFMFENVIVGGKQPQNTPPTPKPTEPSMDMSWEQLTEYFNNK